MMLMLHLWRILFTITNLKMIFFIPPCLSVHMIYGPLDPVNPHPQFIRLYQ